MINLILKKIKFQVKYKNTMSQICVGNINNNIGSYYELNKNKNYISELNNFNLL